MAAQGRESAINLLGQHGTGELMRKGHHRKREQQIGARLPFGRKSIVTADEEDKIARFMLGAFDELDEGGRIERAASGIEEDFAGGGMFGEKVEAVRGDFAHLAICIAAGTL